MKTKNTVVLESKDIREIIAAFLGIPTEAVIPTRYNFEVNGMSEDEIRKKMEKPE